MTDNVFKIESNILLFLFDGPIIFNILLLYSRRFGFLPALNFAVGTVFEFVYAHAHT